MISRVASTFRLFAAVFAIALLPKAHGQTAPVLAYVTVESGVAVIDTATDTVVDTIEVCSPGTPAAASVAVLANRLYVPCANEKVVKVVDWKSRTLIATITPPAPDTVHTNSQVAIAQEAQLYVTTTNGVSIFSTANHQFLNRRHLGAPGRAVTVSQDGSYAYVQKEDGTVIAISTEIPAELDSITFEGTFATEGPVDQPIAFDNIETDRLYLVKSSIFIHKLDFRLSGQDSLYIGFGNSAVATEPGAIGVYLARYGTVNRYNFSGYADGQNWIQPSTVDVRINSFAFTMDQRFYAVDDLNGTLKVHASSGEVLKRLTVQRPRAVTIPPPSVQVTIASSPSSGRRFRLQGLGCPSAYTWYYTPRTLPMRRGLSCNVVFATDPAAPGTRVSFTGWADGTASTTINTPEVDTTYTAIFKTQYELTVSSSPGGAGSISGAGYYGAGSSAAIAASATFGYRFLNWTGPVAAASSASTTVLMNAPATVTGNFQVLTNVGVANVSGQYSDVVRLMANIGPADIAFTGALQFQVNGVNAGPAIPVSGSGIYTANYPVALAAGSYTVTATLTSTSPMASGSSGSGTLTVGKEDLVVAPALNNLQLVAVSNPGGAANSIVFTARLQFADGPGNLDLLKPAVTLVRAATATIPCSVSIAFSSEILTATCQNVPVGAYSVRWQVTGDYYTAPTVNSVLAVYDPSRFFIAGAGRIPRNGGWADFAISMRSADVTSEGSIVYVQPSSNGDAVVASPTVRTVRRDPGKVTIDGPATVNGASGFNFLATVTDNGSPGAGRDSFSFVTFGSDAASPEAPLVQGEILVR